MTDFVIIKHGNPEKQHDWNKYVCAYCECEFIVDGIPYACPECSHALTVEAKKVHITDKEARKIMRKDITMNCCPEEREKTEDEYSELAVKLFRGAECEENKTIDYCPKNEKQKMEEAYKIIMQKLS